MRGWPSSAASPNPDRGARLNLTLPEDLIAELRAGAQREGVSISAWVERLVGGG